MEYPDHYVSYLYFFNEIRDYFECHEYGEHLWLDTGRPEFLKGLIQAAVSLHHTGSGKLEGARKVWSTGKSYLLPYCPEHMGIHIGKLITDIDNVQRMLPLDRMASASTIQALNLPTVKIEIVDPLLRELVASCVPTPIEE